LSQEAAKRQTKTHDQNKRKTERKQKQGKKEGKPAKAHANKPKGTVDKQAGSPYLTLWWKVLMLNQKCRDCLELLLGKHSASVQMNKLGKTLLNTKSWEGTLDDDVAA